MRCGDDVLERVEEERGVAMTEQEEEEQEWRVTMRKQLTLKT